MPITLQLGAGSAEYSGTPVALDPTFVIAGAPANTMIEGAVVQISSGFLSGDELNLINQDGITGSYDAATGMLTLSGTASAADYQAALQSITYSFGAADPTNGGADASRQFSWTVSPVSGGFGLAGGSFPGAQFLTFDAEGNLWATTSSGVTATSALDDFATTDAIANGDFSAAEGIAVDKYGGVFVSDVVTNKITEITGPAYTSVKTIANLPGGSLPLGLSLDSNDDLFFVNNGTSKVEELTAPAYTSPKTIYTATARDNLVDTAINAQGDLFISDQLSNGTGKILELTAASNYTTLEAITTGNLDEPTGIAVDAYGDLFVADAFKNEVVEIYGPGYSSYAVVDASGLSTPLGVALDASGDLFVAEQGGNHIVEISATEIPVPTATSGLDFDYAPVITTTGRPAVYSAMPVFLNGSLTLTDLNSPTLVGAQVSISSGFQSGDLLWSPHFFDNITLNYDAATGVLSLSGTDTLADYQTLLRIIRFSATKTDPAAVGVDGARTISWTVNDGTRSSTIATSDVDISTAVPTGDYLGHPQSDVLIENSNHALVVGWLPYGGGEFSYAQLGTAVATWSFGGSGDFLDDSRSQFLVETSTGEVMLGEVGPAGLAGYVPLGALGPEWRFEATGDFLGLGFDQFLIENTKGAVVIGDVANGQTTFTSTVAALGPEWTFVGAGDFLGDGKSQFLIQNTSGVVVVGEVGANDQTTYTNVTGLGPEWKFVGSGDFLGDGKDQFLIENTSGAVDAGEVSGGHVAWTQVGALGPEWTFVGAGDYFGNGVASFLIENTSGAIFEGTIVNGHAQYANVAALGPEWSFRG
jgi:hypothetical protein